MLTPRQNLLKALGGGKPERYVNQFEPFALQWATPQDMRFPEQEYGGPAVKNYLGVTFLWPAGTPGPFPLQDEEHLVIKDITRWKEYVTFPDTNFSEEEWAPFVEEAEKVDREQYFVTSVMWPGLFENCHHLMGMEECMINMFDEPEAMHELIDAITEYELAMAEQICAHIKPDALYRQDDWGSQKSTFMSKDMFREFFLEPTKRIYDYYKAHGVQLVIHHSDSYCETFVPEMIEMGIDIWQGAMSTNNLPEIIRQYGDKLMLMGGIDNGIVDCVDWTEEKVDRVVREVCGWAGCRSFIPNCTMGGDFSIYEGVYEAVTKAIDAVSKEMF